MKQIDLEPTEHRRKFRNPVPFYRLWHHDPEPVFADGAGKRILLWLVGFLIVTAVSILVGAPIHYLSCTYITGSCL